MKEIVALSTGRVSIENRAPRLLTRLHLSGGRLVSYRHLDVSERIKIDSLANTIRSH